MPTPSLLIVPARFKSGKMYSQIPTSGAGDFNVTRATTATRFGPDGLIASVASGIPRLDYYTSGGVTGCPALLVEPAATNVLSYSEDFTDAAWGKSAMTVSTGTTALFTAPDGTTNADKIIATSGNVVHNISRTGITSAAYTFSVFAKAGEESVISLWLRSASVRAEFNLVSGTVSNITTTSARIENYGNGWYRCTVYDSTAGTTAHVYGRGGGAYAGNGSDGFYLWGAQLEAGSVATSYIPTTTVAPLTRNADVISVSGAVSGAIGQTEGTVYIECQSEFATNDVLVINTAGQSPGNNYIAITKLATNLFRASVVASGTTVNLTESVATTTFAKLALGYASGNTAFYINGNFIASGSTGYTFSGALNRIQFMADLVAGAKPTRIRAVALYTTRLPNTGAGSLQELTSP